MTDATAQEPAAPKTKSSLFELGERTKRRNAAEARFKFYGMLAVGTGVAALLLLLISILSQGLPAFTQTFIKVDITLDETVLDPSGNRDPEEISKVLTFSYDPIINNSLQQLADDLSEQYPDVTADVLQDMISGEAKGRLRADVIANPALIGQTIEYEFLANGRIDGYMKGRVTRETAELDGNVTPLQLDVADALVVSERLEKRFNWAFITAPDASELRPEAAGLGVALIGSAYMMAIVFCLALPIGVAASI
ncbi:MAG: DUF3333 domain-containing protein, partial [Pseudomonadota bacterium]